MLDLPTFGKPTRPTLLDEINRRPAVVAVTTRAQNIVCFKMSSAVKFLNIAVHSAGS